MTNTIKILGILSLFAAAACSSGGGDTATGTTGGSGTTTGGAGSTTGIPAVPTLGAHEIDRMGRPAVNTALTAPLNTYAVDGGSIAGPAAKDLYNSADGDPDAGGSWLQFQGAFASSLAIYDGLDGQCGNQTLANLDGGNSNLGGYGTLAAVLVDDELYVDTSVQTCSFYLGVELNTIGALLTPDCGGRTLTENVIDETYSALAAGVLTGVTNGVTSKAGARNTSTFPFLGTP